MQIRLEIPDGYFAGADPETVAQRIKLYAALLMFQAGDLSAGAAAEFAGVDRSSFYQEAAARGVPVVAYPPEELTQDLANLTPPRT